MCLRGRGDGRRGRLHCRVGVSRADQDAFAVESHRRAVARAGEDADEITPVTVPGSEGDTIVSRDDGPRPDTSLEGLGKLRPAFGKSGTVTAGNASPSATAAAVVVVSEEVARNSRSPLKARLVATATSGVAPKEIFIAPVTAVEKVLAKAKMTMNDIDLIELNEAFAAQCSLHATAGSRSGQDERLRRSDRGTGHPIGASGARVLVTLLHALAERGLKRGWRHCVWVAATPWR